MSSETSGKVLSHDKNTFEMGVPSARAVPGSPVRGIWRDKEQRVLVWEFAIAAGFDLSVLQEALSDGDSLSSATHPGLARSVACFAWDGARSYAASEVHLVDPTRPVSAVLVQLEPAGSPLGEGPGAKPAKPSDSQLRAGVTAVLRAIRSLHELRPPILFGGLAPDHVYLDAEKTCLAGAGPMRERLRRHGLLVVPDLGFLAPEQLAGRACRASDAYSVALTFLSAISGKRPAAMPVDSRTGRVDVRALLPALDGGLRNMLEELTSPIPSQRPAIEKVLRLPPVSESRPGRAKAFFGGLGLGIVVALGTVGGLVWWARNEGYDLLVRPPETGDYRTPSFPTAPPQPQPIYFNGINLVDAGGEPGLDLVGHDGDGDVVAVDGKSGKELWRTRVKLNGHYGIMTTDRASQMVLMTGFDAVAFDPRKGERLGTYTLDDDVKRIVYGDGCFVAMLANDTNVEMNVRGAKLPCPSAKPLPKRWSDWTPQDTSGIVYRLEHVGQGTPRLEATAKLGDKELWRTAVPGTEGLRENSKAGILILSKKRGSDNKAVEVTLLDPKTGAVQKHLEFSVSYIGPTYAFEVTDDFAYALVGGMIHAIDIAKWSVVWTVGRTA